MDSFQDFNSDESAGRHLFSVGPDYRTSPEPFQFHDRYESRSLRPQRPADLLGALVMKVGDAAVLLSLDAQPIPDELFDWSVVEPNDRPFVSRVLERSDRCCNELLDVEYRTIARRILARIAARNARALRTSKNVARFAAGLVWLAGHGSGEFVDSGPRTALWNWFGVSDCADRGRSLRRAAGCEPMLGATSYDREHSALGDASLLHSRFRRAVIAQRDALTALTASPGGRRVVEDGNKVVIRADAPTSFWAIKGRVAGGRRVAIVLGLGDDDDGDIYGMTIPEAHELIRVIERALADPMRRSEDS